MIPGEPAVRGLSAILTNGFVLMKPPELVGLLCCIVWIRPSTELPTEIECPMTLPIHQRHVNGGERLLNFFQPRFICHRHSLNSYHFTTPSRNRTFDFLACRVRRPECYSVRLGQFAEALAVPVFLADADTLFLGQRPNRWATDSLSVSPSFSKSRSHPFPDQCALELRDCTEYLEHQLAG